MSHPDNSPDSIERISVEATRTSPSSLSLRYDIAGDISQLVVPGWVGASRADDLWLSTCFEAFVRPRTGTGYFEFNFSLSGQWAAYGFDAYREGMTAQPGVERRDLVSKAEGGRLSLCVVLDLDRLGLPDGPWQLGLSAVIEEKSGGKSYWALAHPSDKPDFHHPDSFVLELP